MRYCNQCQVHIINKTDKCPLCQNKLILAHSENMAEAEEAFPDIPTHYRQYHLIFQILLFSSIVTAVVAFVINYILPGKGWWSFFVIAALICFWIFVGTALRKRKNISKSILWQMFLVSVISVIWDYSTQWRGWSIDYVIPILYIAAMIILVVVNKILKLNIEDYLVYTLLGGFFGIIPIIFFALGILHNVYPSLFCVAGSIIFLSALFVFQGERMIAELKRRLHW